MKKLLKLKKGEGISGIILILICIILVILILPALRQFQNDNATNTSSIATKNTNFVTKGLSSAAAAPGYGGDVSGW